MPTSPVGYEPSVVEVSCSCPFLKTESVFPSAASLHLSPGTMTGVKSCKGTKPFAVIL